MMVPVTTKFILVSLLIALLLNLIPLGVLKTTVRPDFVLLFLLYWVIHQPHRVGLGVAFLVGLLMDLVDANLFGQHTLAYSMVVYLALILNRRMRMFGLWKQAIHIVILLWLSQIIMVMIRLATGAYFIGWSYFLTSITGALLWPLISNLLQLSNYKVIEQAE